MVVRGVNLPPTAGFAARRGVARGAFGVRAEAGGASRETVRTGGVSAVSLLALQEAESDRQQDQEARQHGIAMADELTALQRALLGDEGPDLARLATLLARPTSTTDPALAGLLRAVRLRAGVELARRGYAASM